MSIMTLWLPVLVAAVFAFIAGSVIWMFMPWHKSDWSKTGDENAVRSALRGLAPGRYNVPHCNGPEDMKKPEIAKKFEEGPSAFVTIVPTGMPTMGPKLIQMFLFNLAVAIICAYFVTRTAAPGADYLAVFRIAGTVAFCSYGMGFVQESIWFGRPWSDTAKTFLDALIYALVTGGVFGWLAA